MRPFRKILPLLLVLLFAGTLVGFSAPAGGKSAKKSGTETVVRKSAEKPGKSAPAKKNAANAPDDDEENELSDEPEELPGENFGADWPTTTRIADMLPARTIQNGPDAWIYETQHFRFTANAPIALAAIKELAKIFEGTLTANLALPINSPCNHYQVCEHGKYNAFLYETYEQYKAAGGLDGTAGVYIAPGGSATVTVTTVSAGGKTTVEQKSVRFPHEASIKRGKVLVPFQSLNLEKRGNRYVKGGKRVRAKTLSHEITHHMTIGANSYPIWFSEGIAEYVGLAYDGNGRCNFGRNKTEMAQYVSAYGGKKERGGRGIGKQPQIGSLRGFLEQPRERFMAADRIQLSYGFSALLVYYFFHIDGKRDAARIKKFLAILQNGGTTAQAYEALLDGRTWEQLEKEVRRGMKSAFKVEPQFK